MKSLKKFKKSKDSNSLRILVGVSGGIAAYKTCTLVRLLRKQGHRVRVVMTASAAKFVAPLTFQALSGRKVIVDPWKPIAADGMDHIRFAENADAFVIAPATANCIAKLANGLGDDALSTLALAFSGPMFLAPAMNPTMYNSPAVQRNISQLRDFGFHLLGPEQGEMACGHQGDGRMSEPEKIFEVVQSFFSAEHSWKDKQVLVTAGPTQEPLDAVRFLTNHSSGKMGYAIARAARQKGAQVTLISGPTHLEPPKHIRFISVRSAKEMHDEVMRNAQCDAVFMAAAVSDFSFDSSHGGKLHKQQFAPSLNLKLNPDILADLGLQKQKGNARPFLVGFSMETDDLINRSKLKCKNKKADLVIANSIQEPDAGFGVDTNRVSLIYPNGEVENWPLLTKQLLAERLLDHVRPKLPQQR